MIEGRIRYDENWLGQGEHYVYEIRQKGEEWSLECAFPVINNAVHYEAITRIREWMKLGVDIHFE